MNKKRKNPSFVIDIKSTEHGSWQGVLRWINEDKQVPFRSALELIRLLDSAIDMQEVDEETIVYQTKENCDRVTSM